MFNYCEIIELINFHTLFRIVNEMDTSKISVSFIWVSMNGVEMMSSI